MAWTRKSSPPQLRLELLEDGVHRRRVGHVAMAGDMRAELGGERLDALLQRVALVGERELRAGCVRGRGDAPGERAVVGDAHDQPALAAHDTARLGASIPACICLVRARTPAAAGNGMGAQPPQAASTRLPRLD